MSPLLVWWCWLAADVETEAADTTDATTVVGGELLMLLPAPMLFIM